MPHLSAVWQLDIYPKHTECDPYIHFYLRLIGFQAADASLSTDKTKSIMADYKIYAVSSTNEKKMIGQTLNEFHTGGASYAILTKEDTNKIIHPDGSLLVICEIKCLASDETFSVEPIPNPELLDANRQLGDHFKKMWKSQVFTDCTIKACVNRLAIDGRAALQSAEWEELKSENKDLANELLELMIKDHPSFGDMQEEVTEDAK
ncbi:BTB and MATH domain-containing protein 42 [Ditylenchus destructor]|nr:BTB and MATH domain-containing protein 42 [Ditylenchus destructor]